MKERLYVRLFLVAAALLVLYFVFRIFQPFLMPIALAAILVSLFYTAFEDLNRRLRDRRSLASLLTCLLITLVIVVPFILLILMLANEARQVYMTFQAQIESGTAEQWWDLRNNRLVAPLAGWLSQYVDLDELDLMGGMAAALQQVSLFFLRHSTAILSGVAQLITSFFVMIITMFFLFRDGASLAREIRTWTPLSRHYENLLVNKFREVSSATVLGSIATAVAQGIAGGIVFWLLGISNIVFWASMMALFSLVPVVGTAIVWVPWTVYFLAIGSIGRAVILVLLATLFVGLIDNVLRPVLIEGRAKMHTLVVFFSIMGGIAYFGIAGMIFGPILVALGLTFIELYKIEFQDFLNQSSQDGKIP